MNAERPGRGRPGAGCRSLVTLAALCAGCTAQVTQTYYSDRDSFDTNNVAFEHAFSDSAAAEARRRADSQCGWRKRVAVETSRACSLDRCTVIFQCMTAADAAAYTAGPQRK